MGKPKKSFNVGNPSEQIGKLADNSKYKIGNEGMSFHDIRDMKPVFAFDYLSLCGEEICFNCGDLDTKDYVGLLEGLKKISDTTYKTMHDTKAYRFHKIELGSKGVNLTKRDFKLKLTHKEELLRDEELPNLWQIDIQYMQEARIAGFLFKGIFYLVWYDRNHKIYK